MNKSDIVPKTLRLLLRYEPDTGNLFWKERGPKWFEPGRITAQGQANQWNSKYAERLAFTATDNHGYRVGSVFNRNLRAHRIAWAIFYGEWPEDMIDHVNGDPTDNRISNLREVTNSENCKNQKCFKNNTSGVTGVCWCKHTKKWRAQIQVGGRQKYLGSFDDKSKAIEAREAAELKHGYHENHGRRLVTARMAALEARYD